ncbi:hypothetical protein PV327_009001 [Microctonus hyperodae]|uniref:Uncharacterized protein n=1 Tax=Microctonus hyperodae TaxID=165561 RepID=A0AA39FTK1_MICHY|nr:hypothetical protein PV327_009001 [Microctonus hyperodae]
MTFSVLGISFDDIKNVYNYVNTLYEKGIEYANKEELARNTVDNQLKQIMSELRDMSKQLTNFVSHQDEKMDQVVKTLLNNIEMMGDFQSVRTELVQCISNVDYWFQNAIEYETNQGYSQKTLHNFIKSVLWSTDNIDHWLFRIYKLIFPGINNNVRKSFVTLALENAEESYERFCDKYISQQQRFYYIFMIIIRTQLKAFVTITQAYALQTAFDHVNYVHEYKAFKQTFYDRLTNYFDYFIHYMAHFPAEIRRCDVQNPVIGENIFQMEGVFQVIIGREFSIKNAIYPEYLWVCGGCEEIVNNTRMQFMIHNCKTYSSISACIETPQRPRYYASRMSSFKVNSEVYGHTEQCTHGFTEIHGIYSPTLCYDDTCVCSVHTTDQTNFPNKAFDIVLDEPRIRRISVEPQYSDIANNMVVVGVKFILHDNVIHLQIEQGKISKHGAVVDEGSWKPVDVDNNNRKIKLAHELMFDRRSIFYLDDVLGDPDSVVTGVRLAVTKDGSGFELHIHSTKYVSQTGQLGTQQKWYTPGEHPINRTDYERNRIEIKLNDPDEPTQAHDYHPDPQSNKFIQFQHTSIKKDAGFHTVPYFDGQSVGTQMKFPLSGVGLFHRERDGFGGYIAPRLITYNMTWSIESSFNDWKQIEAMYKHCGLDVPANVTVFKESVDCDKLKQSVGRQVNIQDMDRIKQNNTINSTIKPLETYEIDKRAKPIIKQTFRRNSKMPIYTKKSSCLSKNGIKSSRVSKLMFQIRIEIKLNDPDDSLMVRDYHPDPQSNKFIQFQHTSIKKDAGFHTVPYFDGQSVETQMKFPLSGVGLFHRERDGFGGYIAPRLITYNMTWIIESSFNNWKQLENMYKRCGLEVPRNVTVFNGYVDCEKLKRTAGQQVHIHDVNRIKENNPIYSQPKSYETNNYKEPMNRIIKQRINKNSKNTMYKKKTPYLFTNDVEPSVILV